MGVQLEWESGNIYEGDAANERRRRWPWLLLLGLMLIAAALYGAFRIRLRQIDEWQMRTLHEIVAAELAALRIGDEEAFLDIQHRGDENWLAQQRAYFAEVQGATELQLRGDILASEISRDGLQGVVRLLEIQDAVPYERLWYYWNFPELGWRHLPQNTADWGEAATLNVETLDIAYFTRDEALARELADTLPGWLRVGCEALACGALPKLRVDILPDPVLSLSWQPLAPWLLRIPSPYLTRVRSDQPFSPELQAETARLISERLLNGSPLAIVEHRQQDAIFLRDAIDRWLVGNFLGQNEASPLLQSIYERYGRQALGELTQLRQEQALLPAIRQVTRASLLELARLDWRDYLEWQLRQAGETNIGRIAALNLETEQENIILVARLQSESADAQTQREIRFSLSGDRWLRLP